MPRRQQTTEERAHHWDWAYASTGVQSLSWYQEAPTMSLGLIEAIGVGPDAALIDVGGGASTLVDRLV